ncbi:hypothetical protein GCM10009789_04380 [Kribbella sancticallisti]|uniref:PknH-like extracellular domain-containing protein n=2 Tax=Kribbella sancticallisti TaxID=460087 RepID=A0ABN2C7G1_9ACTN
MATMGLVLVACGNDARAGGGSGGGGTAGSTPTATPTVTPSPIATPTAPDTPTEPSTTPTAQPTQTPEPTPQKPFRITPAMLLTGSEMAKGDPSRKWRATSQTPGTPICGPSSTRGAGVQGTLRRHFTDELDASGGQWLTRYADARAARAAYGQIVATIKSCKALRPAPTHARKMTENRTLALGDGTRIIRWFDYPLPSDPGSEAGGFPYAVTLEGSVVSVLSFGEMGQGIKPTHFERIAGSAAARLG